MQADHDRQVDYVEFGATDLGLIKQFYQHVFDWRFEDYGPDYTRFQDGRLSGGVVETTSGPAPGAPLVLYTPPPGKGRAAGLQPAGEKSLAPPFFSAGPPRL